MDISISMPDITLTVTRSDGLVSGVARLQLAEINQNGVVIGEGYLIEPDGSLADEWIHGSLGYVYHDVDGTWVAVADTQDDGQRPLGYYPTCIDAAMAVGRYNLEYIDEDLRHNPPE